MEFWSCQLLPTCFILLPSLHSVALALPIFMSLFVPFLDRTWNVIIISSGEVYKMILPFSHPYFCLRHIAAQKGHKRDINMSFYVPFLLWIFQLIGRAMNRVKSVWQIWWNFCFLPMSNLTKRGHNKDILCPWYVPGMSLFCIRLMC